MLPPLRGFGPGICDPRALALVQLFLKSIHGRHDHGKCLHFLIKSLEQPCSRNDFNIRWYIYYGFAILIRSPLDARLGAEQGVYHFCVEIGGIWLDFCQESRHGAGFWQEGMERLTDEEFMVKVVAGGRAYALKMVGKPWRAHRLVMFTFWLFLNALGLKTIVYIINISRKHVFWSEFLGLMQGTRVQTISAASCLHPGILSGKGWSCEERTWPPTAACRGTWWIYRHGARWRWTFEFAEFFFAHLEDSHGFVQIAVRISRRFHLE